MIFTSLKFFQKREVFQIVLCNMDTYHCNMVGAEAGASNLNHLRCPRARLHDDARGNITTVSVETRTLGAKRSSWTTAVLCWPDHDLELESH